MGVTLFHHGGAGEGEWSGDRMIAALRAAGLQPRYCSLESDEVEAVLAATRELAIVAGGDGSVARIATTLPDRRVPIALLPTGSGNNIARSMGAFGELDALIGGLPNAVPAPLSLAEATGPWGARRIVEAVGLGVLAKSTAELQHEELDGREKLEAGRQVVRQMVATIDPQRVAILADGERMDGEVLMVEVLKLGMIGPNLLLAPDLAPGDGKVTLCLLDAGRRKAMVDWLTDPEAGGPPPLRRLRASRVELEADHGPIRVDDKTTDWDGSRVVVEVLPDPVMILVPRRER